MSLERLRAAALFSVFASLFTSGLAHSKPAPPAPVSAPPPLPMLPSVARVKVASHGSMMAIVQEVLLPRGDWKSETLRFHIAFGAPGPRALDVHLVPVGDGALEPEDDEVGEALSTERVPRRPGNAYALLGHETMAGVVVQVKPDSFGKALARGAMAALRIRSLIDAIEPDASGASSVVVRLGASRSTPLTLGRIVATSVPPAPAIARAEAHLCGPDADPHPLAVGIVPRPAVKPPASEPAPIAPVLAVRHATDDLCVRLWPVGK